mmetsp:Transcript_4171/g.10053  ORF Transcript_4171/g.10053 Transcript_4171/m.10053 type:complete len:236 (+) Transcript_4171:961-1668(+)
MRTVVLEPTNLSMPFVGAPLKRITNSWLSISAPFSSRRRIPLLPTIAQLSYRRPPTRSRAGSHFWASLAPILPIRFHAGSFPGMWTLMRSPFSTLGLSRASMTGPAKAWGSSLVVSLEALSFCTNGVVTASEHAQVPFAIRAAPLHLRPVERSGHWHESPLGNPCSRQDLAFPGSCCLCPETSADLLPPVASSLARPWTAAIPLGLCFSPPASWPPPAPALCNSASGATASGFDP